MSILTFMKSLIADPPPEFAFEISASGIAWAEPSKPAAIEWTPLPEGAIAVSPLEDNVRQPEALAAAVRLIALSGSAKKRRRAALILPDYSARITVLDFDTFPADPQEQIQLARFRVKRVVPFDIDSAVIACYPQQRAGSKKLDVVVAVVNMDVASHFEAPFRAAGFQCGFVTISALAALSLPGDSGADAASPSVVAKLSGNVLAVSLIEGATVRMIRCVELRDSGLQEAADVLATTFAYAEDELGARPQVLRLCGLPRDAGDLRRRWSDEFGLPVTGVHSRFGSPGAFNSGLHGYLHSLAGS
ncbi:MAG: hypothetical protein HY858_12945 [Candidatus Solibacter usitatus]|nr:hypothetical protein [Candidatus Solibacter usitatus]